MFDPLKILDTWTERRGVQFISRFGQYTASIISRDSLLDLISDVRAAMLKEMTSRSVPCLEDFPPWPDGVPEVSGKVPPAAPSPNTEPSNDTI